MKDYQKKFIEFALENNVLCFGDFTLKSGRKSPYFFNAGLFHSSKALSLIGEFYAHTIKENFTEEFDVLFGPAYKGISLATVAASRLYDLYNVNVNVSFNRKEVKDHGEKKLLIGSELKNKKVLIVDDVITAGITIYETLDLIKANGGTCVGIVILLDRMEKNVDDKLSAIESLRREHNLKVVSIINIEILLEYLETHRDSFADHLTSIKKYLQTFGNVSTSSRVDGCTVSH